MKQSNRRMRLNVESAHNSSTHIAMLSPHMAFPVFTNVHQTDTHTCAIYAHKIYAYLVSMRAPWVSLSTSLKTMSPAYSWRHRKPATLMCLSRPANRYAYIVHIIYTVLYIHFTHHHYYFSTSTFPQTPSSCTGLALSCFSSLSACHLLH